MEYVKQVFDFTVSNWELIVLVLGVVFHVYKQKKLGKSTSESLILAFNVLKDEAKMVDGKFSDDAIKKLEEVSEVIGTSKESVEKVKTAMRGAEVDIKLGSYRGKPIYLSEALGLGAIIRKLQK